MSLILQESPGRIMDQALIQKHKLRSMKEHLELLLQKKIRIDNEIRILKKSIQDKSKKFQLSLKTSINLEAYDQNHEPTELTRKLLEEKFPDLTFLQDYDVLLREIDDLLQEIQDNMGE